MQALLRFAKGRTGLAVLEALASIPVVRYVLRGRACAGPQHEAIERELAAEPR